MSSSRRSSILLLACFATALLAAPGAVAAPGAEAPRHLVTLTLTVGQAEPVTFRVPDGALATLEGGELARRLGVVAHVVDAAAGDVDVELVDLAVPPAGKPHAAPAAAAATLVERVTGKVGFAGAATVGTVPVDVEVVAVAPAPAAVQRACAEAAAGATAFDPGGVQPIKDPINPPGCCVVCDGLKVCACQVDRGCGTCCGCGLC